jgi:hypothetical protein
MLDRKAGRISDFNLASVFLSSTYQKRSHTAAFFVLKDISAKPPLTPQIITAGSIMGPAVNFWSVRLFSTCVKTAPLPCRIKPDREMGRLGLVNQLFMSSCCNVSYFRGNHIDKYKENGILLRLSKIVEFSDKEDEKNGKRIGTLQCGI